MIIHVKFGSFLSSEKIYFFLFQYGHMIKLCPVEVAVLHFWSTQKEDFGNFSQWESIIGHSRHVDFPNETKIIENAGHHPSSISTKFSSNCASGLWEIDWMLKACGCRRWWPPTADAPWLQYLTRTFGAGELKILNIDLYNLIFFLITCIRSLWPFADFEH